MFQPIKGGSTIKIQGLKCHLKTCTKCRMNKPLSCYRFRSDQNKHRTTCKDCDKNINDNWAKKTSWRKLYYEKTKDKQLDRNKKRYEQNRERIIKQQSERQQKNRNKINEFNRAYTQKRRDNDPFFKLRKNTGHRIQKLLKNKKGSLRTQEILGCNYKTLKEHIESKFKPDMCWENYGYRGWHIDHVIPVSWFDLTDKSQLLQAFHYTNLQPLWAKENLSKGNRRVYV